MEPIAEDIVEHAEDFFFKLDDKQVLEQIKEYEKRQPAIFRYLWVTDQVLKSKESYILISRFTLMTDYCYRSYPVNLSIIEKATVSNSMKPDKVSSFCPPLPDPTRVDTDAAYLQVEQIHLTAIYKAKEILYDDETIPAHRKASGEIWISLITILHLYQNEAKKQMSKLRLS